MRQSHVSALFNLFGELAKSYGKSARDENRSIVDLKAIGAKKEAIDRGLEPATINRHLSHLGQVIKRMRSGGAPLDDKIEVSVFHLPEITRDRDKRQSLTVEDSKALFALPPFAGCKGWTKGDSFEGGQQIYHRGLYFAPIGLHYTGARREEVWGLEVDDVVLGAAIPYFFIRKNRIRRIKNGQSTRAIPIPPEMIRLNFFDYVAAVRRLGYIELFPDLKSPTSSSPLGDRLYREIIDGIEKAVPQDGKRTKVIHSIRTAFGANVKRQKVDVETRADLMGHGGDCVTDEVYADPTELEIKLEVMAKIPNVTSDLVPHPIRLVPWIAQKLPCPFSQPSRQKNRKVKV
jgi:integrase